MKTLNRIDLQGWSRFDEARNLDFNSVAWIRDGGNVLVDPLELSSHDLAHLRSLGGAATVVITNSAHVRDAGRLATELGAQLLGPAAEREGFPIACHRWLSDGDEIVPGLRVLELHGSKTPGELALVLDGTTLITGDLIRGPRGGSLDLLADAKLTERSRALDSVRRLLDWPLEAVLVGDGWPVFRDGRARLVELLARRAPQ
jgi:glyoxylase-like metal-dependent hydrolase (beta-lactamase superfamily II)